MDALTLVIEWAERQQRAGSDPTATVRGVLGMLRAIQNGDPATAPDRARSVAQLAVRLSPELVPG